MDYKNRQSQKAWMTGLQASQSHTVINTAADFTLPPRTLIRAIQVSVVMIGILIRYFISYCRQSSWIPIYYPVLALCIRRQEYMSNTTSTF